MLTLLNKKRCSARALYLSAAASAGLLLLSERSAAQSLDNNPLLQPELESEGVSRPLLPPLLSDDLGSDPSTRTLDDILLENLLLQQNILLQEGIQDFEDIEGFEDAEATGEEPTAPLRDTASIEPGDPAGDPAQRRAAPVNQRVAPVDGAFPQREEDPYAPLGIRFGRFIVTSTLEQGLVWTSNADSTPEGSEATQSETTLRFNAQSDWSRHAAAAQAYGRFVNPVSGDDYSERDLGIDASLQLDLASDYVLLARFGYQASPEDASSPVSFVDVEDRPLLHAFDGSLEFAKILGKLRFNATGGLRHELYGDATALDGSTISQEDRNNTLATARLRLGYELSPALIPFIEGEIGHRFYDNEVDSAGFRHAARQTAFSVGAAIDRREKLYGEASIGWISENPEDERLDTISGLALSANLNWSPERGTVIGLDLSTVTEGTTDAGEVGSILHSGTLRLEREIRSNLSAEALASLSWRDYTSGDHDTIVSGQVGLTWSINRNLALFGRARYERLSSDLAFRDYDSQSVFIGLRLQR